MDVSDETQTMLLHGFSAICIFLSLGIPVAVEYFWREK